MNAFGIIILVLLVALAVFECISLATSIIKRKKIKKQKDLKKQEQCAIKVLDQVESSDVGEEILDKEEEVNDSNFK